MIRLLLLSCASLIAVTGMASAEELVRKAGEWEMTTQSGPGGPSTQKRCFGTDKSVSDLKNYQGRMKNCSAGKVDASGNTITMDSSCTMPNNGKAVMHVVITRTGTDAYHTEGHMHFEGAPQGTPGDMTFISDAKRLGPCQPGEQPVD